MNMTLLAQMISLIMILLGVTGILWFIRSIHGIKKSLASLEAKVSDKRDQSER